jgi:hypothetical protein
MVEIWMLFSLFLPFLEVVLQSYVNYLRCKETQDDKVVNREANKGTLVKRADAWDRKIENRQVVHGIFILF